MKGTLLSSFTIHCEPVFKQDWRDNNYRGSWCLEDKAGMELDKKHPLRNISYVKHVARWKDATWCFVSTNLCSAACFKEK